MDAARVPQVPPGRRTFRFLPTAGRRRTSFASRSSSPTRASIGRRSGCRRSARRARPRARGRRRPLRARLRGRAGRPTASGWPSSANAAGRRRTSGGFPTSGGEAERVSDAAADVSEAIWSPDGEWIAYVAPDGPPADRERRERERDDARVVDEDDRPGRLWLVRVTPDAEGRLTGRKLLATGFSVGGAADPTAPDSIAFSPDGQHDRLLPHPAPRHQRLAELRHLARGRGHGRRPALRRDRRRGDLAALLARRPPSRLRRHRRAAALGAQGEHPAGAAGRRQVPARTLPPSFDESPELAGFSADGADALLHRVEGRLGPPLRSERLDRRRSAP